MYSFVTDKDASYKCGLSFFCKKHVPNINVHCNSINCINLMQTNTIYVGIHVEPFKHLPPQSHHNIYLVSSRFRVLPDFGCHGLPLLSALGCLYSFSVPDT